MTFIFERGLFDKASTSINLLVRKSAIVKRFCFSFWSFAFPIFLVDITMAVNKPLGTDNSSKCVVNSSRDR